MGKKLISLILGLSLTCTVSAPAFAAELEVDKETKKVQAIEKLEKLSDETVELKVNDGQVFLSGELSDKEVPGEGSATKFLEENKELFGIDNTKEELKVVEVNKDDIGDTFVKFAQVIEGTEVDNSLINVHYDKNGVIVSVNGNLEENKEITTLGSKVISPEKAIEIAKSQFEFKKLKKTPKAEKLVITEDGVNYEVYKINIFFMEPTIGCYDVYIEVNSGKVIKTENKIRYNTSVTGTGIDVLGKTRELKLSEYKDEAEDKVQYGMVDLTNVATEAIATYDAKNSTEEQFNMFLVSNTTKEFTAEEHKAPVSAHYNADKVIDFYKNLFNRNSIDNKGMAIESITHLGSNYNNAFWAGDMMFYGDGDGEEFTYLSGDLDVVGHEMTHGLVEYTAGLVYEYQPGALDESMADVFGVLISTYDKYNVANGGTWKFNSADWVVGDDIYTPNIQGDALRSLADPTIYGQPAHMDNYWDLPKTDDDGGVHSNSGIPNKAAYNIAKSIGMDKTAKIYYRALTQYMHADTNFQQAAYCLVQAAADLYGKGSNEITVIKNSFASTGVAYKGQKPVISGATAKNATVGNVFDTKAGVTAADLEDGILTSKIAVSGTINTNKVGKYTLTYTVADSDGNKVSIPRVINVVARNVQINALIGTDRYDTAVRLSKGQFTTANTVMIANGGALADGLAATPLATFKKAPLLLTEASSLPEGTKGEIKRLGAKNAIIVGGSGVVNDSVIKDLKALGVTNVERIGGKDRYETSLEIAKYIDKNCYEVSKVVISNGHGEADALSIASVAGRDKMAIVLVEKDTIPTKVYSWLQSESLQNAYIIGGTGVVSDNVLSKVNGITSGNITKNRLGGKDRYATNAMVIDKFYGSVVNKTYIAKGYELVDALAAGPVAALNGSPVVLSDDDLTTEQKTVLDKRFGNIIIRTGGGIADKAVNSLKSCIQQ
ncbi:cell wall-binding repeat-containing protein [Clostridium sp. UBA7339]|uniref:cell wall-binding repeat-containing protein n=1 Tax=Clostridium sp. UBA7339 TaxID=1946376 RepID=UPI0032166F69